MLPEIGFVFLTAGILAYLFWYLPAKNLKTVKIIQFDDTAEGTALCQQNHLAFWENIENEFDNSYRYCALCGVER